jgi:tryptophanyl-tRNA synthetase
MMKKKDPNTYPKGFGRKQVESVIDHYESQTEDEAIAEADAAFENSRMTLVRVPNELVEEVERLISRHTKKRKSA